MCIICLVTILSLFFVLKMSSAFHLCCIYPSAFQARFFMNANNYGPRDRPKNICRREAQREKVMTGWKMVNGFLEKLHSLKKLAAVNFRWHFNC